jgi:hypothetical protein
VFLGAIVDTKDEYIYMPKNITELNRVSSCHGVAGLPGCCGSIDVVHVKWVNCPTGDFNRAKGKETFPSLGFECITDFNRRVLSIYIYGPHFGSRNNMDIVKTDEYVHEVKSKRLFRNAHWSYYLLVGQGPHMVPMTPPLKVLIKPPRQHFHPNLRAPSCRATSN